MNIKQPNFQQPAGTLSRKERIVWIDQLRGFAFLLVIIGHSLSKGPLKEWIYSFHMPLFFIITGLTLNTDKLLKIGFFEYIRKNTRELLIPYFWLYFFLIPFEWFRVSFICGKTFHPLNYLIGFFESNNNIGSLVSIPLYFLPLLFVSKLAVMIIVKLTHGSRVYCSVAFSFILCSWLFFNGKSTVWHLTSVPAVIFFIYSGTLIMELYRKYEEKLKSSKAYIYISVIAVLFALGVVFSNIIGRASMHHSTYGSNLLFFLLAAFSSSFAVTMIFIRLPALHLFGFLGKYSLFCIGIHLTVIKLINSAFPALEKPLWAMPVKVVAVLLVLIPLSFIFERTAPYLAGKRVASLSAPIKAFKFTSVIWVSFTYFAFTVKKFISPIQEHFFTLVLLSVGYLAICFLFTVAVNRFLPEFFMQSRQLERNSPQ